MGRGRKGQSHRLWYGISACSGAGTERDADSRETNRGRPESRDPMQQAGEAHFILPYLIPAELRGPEAGARHL